MEENRKKSGVYRFVNKTNGKSYIGSSTDLGRRFKTYYSIANLSKIKINSGIYNALFKYGYSNFSLEILEYCDIAENIKREQYYIDKLNPEYNILKTAGSNLGYRHTEEAIAKIRATSLNFSEETKKKSVRLRWETQSVEGLV